MKNVLIPILIFSLFNCKTLNPSGNKNSFKVSPLNDKGIVFIYRPSFFAGSAISYIVKANNQPLMELNNGVYKSFTFNPGEVTFEAETIGSASITFDVKKGEIYFLKGNVLAGPLIGKPFLTLVSNDIGEKEISECMLKN
ncbi:DUF2846 domain-containing protein [Leptospira sp. WS39.C2]